MAQATEFKYAPMFQMGKDETEYRLICEIMGKHSNIILVDADGNIVDSVRRVSAGISSVRLVLPKLKYELPPAQEKQDPLSASDMDFFIALSSDLRMDKALSSSFYGLSPAVAGMLIDGIKTRCRLSDDDIMGLSKHLVQFYSSLSKAKFNGLVCIHPGFGIHQVTKL